MKIITLLCLLLSLLSFESTFSAPGENIEIDYIIDAVGTEPDIPIIDLLEVGESYQIEITSIGCFNGSRQTLSISRQANSYLVGFGDSVQELSANEINAIRDFELELQSLSLGGCSTVDTYKLVYGAKSTQVSDGTCSFNGGRKLMQQLGLVPSK